MNKFSANKNKALLIMGLGSAIAVAAFLSPFASSNPDGLDRVAQDYQFDQKADENPLSHKLPFHQVFDEYAMRGVPSSVATPLAGLVGTLVTFGLTWGLGKVLVKKSDSTH
ncbi:MAG: PDGLE domain-containing protein [Snowella sp.]|nr:PDGLE domain-containing protein [Snowella sp.]